MHATTQLRIYSTTEEAGTPQKQLFLITAQTFKQGGKVLGTCRSCVWLSHTTQLMNEARLVLLEEECQSVRTKTKTSKSGKACRIQQEQGSLQEQEILQQCF